MREIDYNTQEIILLKNFPKFPPFWSHDIILTPETALFKHFEQIFEAFGLFTQLKNGNYRKKQ